MKIFDTHDHYVIVLAKGENLIECLEQFVAQKNVKTAWLQGLGAALELEIGYYDLDTKEYKWRQLQGTHEITAMQGNMTRDSNNQPIFHIHGTFSDTESRAYGGHIKRLIVAGACEILIRPLEGLNLTRQTDPATGLNLLCHAPEEKVVL